MSRKTPALAALTFSLADQAAGEIQLTPAGAFRAWDGRPDKVDAWRIDAASAARVIAAAKARANPLPIDYEHQTLLAEKNGQPAPAAGWFKDLVWREGQGLFATGVEWTAQAAQWIKDKAYRYISPVFEFDPVTGEVQAMRMAALTNNPGLDGMAAVALSAYFTGGAPANTKETPVNELLKKLLAALGLPEATTEETALTAVAALKAKADGQAGEIAALKAATPDPAKFVSVETMTALQGQVAALTAQIQGGEAAKVIDGAMAAGKLLPAQKAWAEDLGKKDLAALKAYVETAPVIVQPGNTQTGGKPPAGAGQSTTQTSDELAVCKALGLTPEQFAKGKQEN